MSIRVPIRALSVALVALGSLAAASCLGAAPSSSLRAVEVARGLDNPVYALSPPGDPRLFVVEQAGRIRIVRDGSLLARPFLDLSGKSSYGGERGLLSMAFHPRYAQNGYFYVNYTDVLGDTRVERYRVSADPDRADPATAHPVLFVDQPYANHNGGHILFGPDGMLYVAMGDGGSGGDPQGNGQNLGTLLGKILRIDVDTGDPYAIPAANPYRGQTAARAEIWLSGLRNPWRVDFDEVDGLLYVADVGQSQWEEIHVVPTSASTRNLGWNRMEGAHCYGPDPCDPAGLDLPALVYGHAEGCSITGGYVYRGRGVQELVGHYVYADYCRGWIRSFRYQDGKVGEDRTWETGPIGRILSFGEDDAGELYVLSDNGRVYRLDAPS